MMTRDQILSRIRGFVEKNFLNPRPDLELDKGDSLLTTCTLESMGVAETLAFLQEEFGVTVPDQNLTEENLGNVASIAYDIGEHGGGKGRQIV